MIKGKVLGREVIGYNLKEVIICLALLLSGCTTYHNFVGIEQPPGSNNFVEVGRNNEGKRIYEGNMTNQAEIDAEYDAFWKWANNETTL